MPQDEEQAILDFLRQEALASRFESTTAEIANGAKLSYNHVGRLLERLIIKGQVGYRERGTERKSVRYFYLSDLLELCRKEWS
jgi:transcription initiation factor IIE alpha subunit